MTLPRTTLQLDGRDAYALPLAFGGDRGRRAPPPRRPAADPQRPPRPWLFGIALRVAADHRRLARHRYELRDDEQAGRAPALDAPVGDQVDRRALVQRGLDALDLDKRAVLILHDVEGHGMPEIAATLGIPLNTAYSRLRLARERFRRAVTDPRGGGP